jgi:PPOX class probable F420-dependent enzyme
MPEMTPAQREAFLRETRIRETRIAKLATLNADGSPTIVPVWFEWDGETAAVFTGRGSPKVRRLARDARVALSVEEGVGAREAWVTIEGNATIVDEGGYELAERLAHRYYEEPRRSQALAEWAKMRDDFVVLRITPTRIRTGG